MANSDTRAAWAYHEATKHSLESARSDGHRLDWQNQPRPYKLYVDLEAIPLPGEGRSSGLPALRAIGTVEVGQTEARVPDLATLTTVLQYAAGITKHLRFAGGDMAFRAAACTGALYHIELYIVCGDLPDLAAGVYHFGIHDRALRRLRAGDFREALVEATGGEPAINAAPASIVCTSTYWRNAWKYQARAYRHSFWDNGTILANMLAVAAAHDLPARVVASFVDEQVNALIGADGEREAAMTLVALGNAPDQPTRSPVRIEPIGLATAPLSQGEVDYPAIREMHAASSLRTIDEVVAWRAAAMGAVPAGSAESGAGTAHESAGENGHRTPLRPIPPESLPSDPVENVIRRRGSARRFEPASIALDALSTMLTYATRGFSSDFRSSPETALTEPYLIVNAVDGLEAGAYSLNRDAAAPSGATENPALELLQAGDFREVASYLALTQSLAGDAAVNAYFLADLEPILARFGNRGYRIAQLDASITAGRLYLAAYALGLGATGLTFFDDDVTRFFSPHAEGKSVMFLIAIGSPARRRPIAT